MPTLQPSSDKNLDGYGAPPIEFQRVLDAVASGLTQGPDAGGPNRHTTWLSTINPDGTPHVMPLGTFFDDGTFYFTLRLLSGRAPSTRAVPSGPHGNRHTRPLAVCRR